MARLAGAGFAFGFIPLVSHDRDGMHICAYLQTFGVLRLTVAKEVVRLAASPAAQHRPETRCALRRGYGRRRRCGYEQVAKS